MSRADDLLYLEVEAGDRSFMNRGACRTAPPGVFFPEKHVGVNAYQEARTYCADCPVREECLDYILTVETPNQRHGMWGGHNPRERHQLVKMMREAAA